MKAKERIIVVVVIIIVAVLASFLVISFTGNAIKVDAKNKGVCQYITYKQASSAMSVANACSKLKSNYLPQEVIFSKTSLLYNHADCSPSYVIFGVDSDIVEPYLPEYANFILGNTTLSGCNNAKFPDGSLNGNYSSEAMKTLSGVLCCKKD